MSDYTHPAAFLLREANLEINRLRQLLRTQITERNDEFRRLLKDNADLASQLSDARAEIAGLRERLEGEELKPCCYGGMKRKRDCASCAAWGADP